MILLNGEKKSEMNGKLVVDKVIAIRQLHKIKLPDAIILATALVSDMELVTANVADFIHIEPRLRIYNPMI